MAQQALTPRRNTTSSDAFPSSPGTRSRSSSTSSSQASFVRDSGKDSSPTTAFGQSCRSKQQKQQSSSLLFPSLLIGKRDTNFGVKFNPQTTAAAEVMSREAGSRPCSLRGSEADSVRSLPGLYAYEEEQHAASSGVVDSS